MDGTLERQKWEMSAGKRLINMRAGVASERVGFPVFVYFP